MIPINTICPECLARLTAGLEAQPDDGERRMLFWCSHNRVGGAVELLPGSKTVGHWILQPAASADAARAAFQNAAYENAIMSKLAVDLAQAQRPAIIN